MSFRSRISFRSLQNTSYNYLKLSITKLKVIFYHAVTLVDWVFLLAQTFIYSLDDEAGVRQSPPLCYSR